MTYVLILALVGLAAFQCLSIVYDLPLRIVLYKMIGRFFEPPEALRPQPIETPYRRIARGSGPIHKPILLNLETSDGSGQAVHPDVAYIPGGFGQGNWPYWMVCTPYPYGNERFENPEIFVSRDGITWFIPEGAQNPVVPAPGPAANHHSDPDILFHDNLLWLVYRQTIRRENTRENILYLLKSADGVVWSSPIEILRDNVGAELLSPSLIHDGTCFILWTIENSGGEFHIMRRTSQDGVVWDQPVRGRTSGFADGRHPWHIDVTREKGRLSAVLVTCTAVNGGGSRIHYAHSLDHGFHWRVNDFLMEQVYEFESSLQYRGTLRCLGDSAETYQFWYSAVSKGRVSSILYLPLVRVQDNLRPSRDPVIPLSKSLAKT